MTVTDSQSTAVRSAEEARAEVLAARTTLAEWETKERAAAGDLEALERLAGERILNDPAGAIEVEQHLASARAAVATARRAVVAQRPRVLAAESRYFAAEATALDALAAEARTSYDKHQHTTEQLLAKLERHEGTPYKPLRPGRDRLLLASVTNLEDQATLVRELAAGRNPADWVLVNRYSVISGAKVALPDHLTADDALIPTHDYLDRAEEQRARLAELEQAFDDLPVQIAAREEHLRYHEPDNEFAADFVWRQLRSRQASLEAELAAARTAVEAVLGPDALRTSPVVPKI